MTTLQEQPQIKDIIRERRKARKLTQDELAEELRRHFDTRIQQWDIAKIENGTPIGIQRAIILGKFFEIDPMFLMGLSEKP